MLSIGPIIILKQFFFNCEIQGVNLGVNTWFQSGFLWGCHLLLTKPFSAHGLRDRLCLGIPKQERRRHRFPILPLSPWQGVSGPVSGRVASRPLLPMPFLFFFKKKLYILFY